MSDSSHGSIPLLPEQDELVEQYDGKFLAIKDNAVIGVYDSDLEAIERTAEMRSADLLLPPVPPFQFGS